MDKDRDEDTLSFTSIVQSQTSPDRPNSPPSDRSFEFLGANFLSPSPADHLFSNGHLLPHHFSATTAKLGSSRRDSPAPSFSTSSRTTSRSSSTTSRSSSTATSRSSSSSGGGGSRRRCLRQGSVVGRRSTESASGRVEPRRVPFQLLGPMVGPDLGSSLSGRGPAARPRSCAVGTAGMKRGEERRRGFFGSIVAACRECHALEPSSAVVRDGIKAE